MIVSMNDHTCKMADARLNELNIKTSSATARNELFNADCAFVNIFAGETISNEPVFARAFESLCRILPI